MAARQRIIANVMIPNPRHWRKAYCLLPWKHELQLQAHAPIPIDVGLLNVIVSLNLRIQGLLVDNVNPATGDLINTTYLGKRVVVDDSLYSVAGTNRITYHVVMYGAGAFSQANGKVETPSELTRNALVGDGGGQTVLSSRVNSIFHPNGFQALAAGVADVTATYAELVLAGAWDRVVARKNVPMAFLLVND